MRILNVNNSYHILGGSERYFFELHKLLEENGNEVIPFSIKNKKNITSSYQDYFMSPVDFFGRKNIFEYFSTCRRVISSPEAKRRIEKLIEKFRPDIAHLHVIFHGISPSILPALKKCRIPIVQTAHSYEAVCPSAYMYSRGEPCDICKNRRFYHAALKRCSRGLFWPSLLCSIKMYIHKLTKVYENNVDLFIAPSRFMMNKLTECGIDAKKIRHIPHFIDTDAYEPKYCNSNHFLYFGRLRDYKGVITLIKAMRHVKGLSLYIAGEGSLEPAIYNLIQKFGLKNVKLLGYISGRDLHDVISNALFTVVPSEWYENFPLSILESFALGKPVIGSNIGGIPEIIEDGVNGLLFESKNEEALAQGIRYLLERPDKCIQMGRNARMKIEAEYNHNLHYERIAGVYNTLLR